MGQQQYACLLYGVGHMKKMAQLTLEENKSNVYEYILEGKQINITLVIEDTDIFLNADDEIDCPLETVLRKHSLTLKDLKMWDIQKVRFVEISDGTEKTLQVIEYSNVLNSITL